MKKLVIEATKERIVAQSGLAIVGNLLSLTNLASRLNAYRLPDISRNPVCSNGDVAKSYIGLLCQGKSDYDNIETFREDAFFALALDIQRVPSSPTLRQRLDQAALTEKWKAILHEESLNLIRNTNAEISPVYAKDKPYIPVDLDVSPFDNSKTKKEGVERTYKGCDGYAPMFGYIGQEGYCLHVEMRKGNDHCQKGTPNFIKETIQSARRLTDQPLLFRLDSGNDSRDNLIIFLEEHASFVIKRNPRKEKAEDWLHIAQKYGICCEEREGKKVYLGSIPETIQLKDQIRTIRKVFKVIERTISRDGQIFLIPEYEFETYWTDLEVPPHVVISLYHDHGTCEQFHSEIKSELDLERLPSVKYETNGLVLHFGVFAYNLLRLIGQESLKKQDAPLKKKATRRRIRTVIQNMITLASKLVYQGRQWKLKVTATNKWLPTFARLYDAFY
ncbi:IS1380 family transposase [Weizmannia coagulans]|uniref:IS1380 family transposase n=1 Tax=Heyndrickxia TaxID=2837504 RepID=UPI0009BB29FF|nr:MULTISPECIES: IS1380 family transposase [Heyndrickxia]MDL4846140.1 IS1380 family transposase [Heyndrickxia coagulans]QAU27265.1 IS1380 family transposase [Heyndrickxia coagulans]QYF69665.1 IS1380 family transposase [Heyndrickxia coagulans]RCS31757.1 IS1380 family transposase [Heyndrickxia coagulans]UYT04120.1 IS1380 family transposase [Weizmannia sp. WK01]